jgi:hypothetical protein
VHAVVRAFDKATDTNDPRDWKAAVSKLVRAIEACRTAADVERLLRAYNIFDEGPFWPEGIKALVARASATKSTKDANGILGWVAATAGEPAAPFRGDPRSEHVSQLRAHVATFRAMQGHNLAGATYLVGLTSRLPGDARALLRLADTTDDAVMSATALLAAGMLLHRRANASAIAAAKLQASSALGSRDRLVRLAGAVVLALIEDPVREDALALPLAWGWHCEHPPRHLASDAMALALLGWIRPAKTPRALELLVARKGIHEAVADSFRRALVHLAFSPTSRAEPAIVDAVGSSLGKLEKRVLAALSDKTAGAFGLAPYMLKGMLTGRETEWRVSKRPVVGLEGPWHFNRLLASVARGDVAVDDAADAVVATFSGPAAIVLVTRPVAAHFDNVIRPKLGEPEVDERLQRLALGVLSRLEKKGIDLEPHFARAAKDSGLVYATQLAPMILQRHGKRVPEAYRALVTGAIEVTRAPEPLRSLLRRLPANERAALLREAEPSAARELRKLQPRHRPAGVRKRRTVSHV